MSITVTDLVIFLVGLLLGVLIGAVFFGDDADAAARAAFAAGAFVLAALA